MLSVGWAELAANAAFGSRVMCHVGQRALPSGIKHTKKSSHLGAEGFTSKGEGLSTDTPYILSVGLKRRVR